MPSSAGIMPVSRQFQLDLWHWDVFLSHAGEDKAFAAILHKRLLKVGLRSFFDKESLLAGSDVPQSLEAAVRSTQIAVVLLSEEFFQKDWPQQELRWFLDDFEATRCQLVPVFLTITHERAKELTSGTDLHAVCKIKGMLHKGEPPPRSSMFGFQVSREDTMERIVAEVCRITGV